MHLKSCAICLIFAIFFSFSLSAQERTHIVQRGETIFSIAGSFSVDRNELMKLNNITDPTRLLAGQRLRIPGDGSKPAQEYLYNVIRGDTLYGIARNFGVSVNEILAANSLASNYLLKQGDVLKIPGVQAIPVSPAPSLAAVTPASPVRAADAPDSSVLWPVKPRELKYMAGNSSVIVTGERSEAVKSLTSGTVISAGPYRGYGRVAIIQSSGGYVYVYGGCESLTVREGDKVGPGMEMGRLGIDPITGKPQLFFRVYHNNLPVDPAKAPRA